MGLLIVSVTSVILFGVLSWWVLGHQKFSPRTYLIATLFGFSAFVGGTYIDAFWVLFLAGVVLSLGAFIASKTQFGPPVLLGLIGAFWLSVPIYVSHVQDI